MTRFVRTVRRCSRERSEGVRDLFGNPVFGCPDPTRPDPVLKPLKLNVRPPAEALTREAQRELARPGHAPTDRRPALERRSAAGTTRPPTGGRAR